MAQTSSAAGSYTPLTGKLAAGSSYGRWFVRTAKRPEN